MKNLANCKPSEFLRQTNRIRHYVQKWMDITELPQIRKRLPQIPEGATAEEKKALLREQSMKNLSDMLDSALDKHPEETMGVLALACFIPAEEAEDHPMDEYLDVLMVMNNNIQHGFGGAKITQRYADYFNRKKEDTRTAKQIVKDTMRRGGLTFAKDIKHE